MSRPGKKTLVASVLALAVPLIVHFEGTVYKTYRDPIGIVTACTGHTGPELSMGQKFTKEQCDDMLQKDLAKHWEDLDCIKYPLKPNEAAAFLSFTFNVGKRNFCGSTLARKANTGDMRGACAELSRWTYAGGKELPGLVARRKAERALCESPS
jgi:lysozyme